MVKRSKKNLDLAAIMLNMKALRSFRTSEIVVQPHIPEDMNYQPQNSQAVWIPEDRV
jgi:hypothetical protein